MQIHQLHTENFHQNTFLSHGIPIMLLVEITQKISKKFKTLDALSGYGIVAFKTPIKLANEDKTIFSTKLNKEISVAIVPYGKELQLELNGDIRYFKTNEIQMIANTTPNASFPTLDNLTAAEEKAYNWLISNGVGKSAKTICFHTYPKIREYMETIQGKSFEAGTPSDSDDFSRCIKVIETLELTNDQINNLSTISPKWKKLIENFGEIQLFIEKEEHKEAYKLIQECIKDTNQLKM